MNSFDCITLLNLAIAGYAFLRLRPASFVFSANMALAGNALSKIARDGRPSSEAFIPYHVFSSENLETASNLYWISTVILAGFVVAPALTSRSIEYRSLPVPRAIRYLMYLFFALMAIASRSILTTAYTSADQTVFEFNAGGGAALIFGLLIYDEYTAARQQRRSPIAAFIRVFLWVAVTDLAKGSTGYASGTLVCAAIVILGVEPKASRRWPVLGSMLLASLLVAYVVRSVRATLFDSGASAVAETLEKTVAGTPESADAIRGQTNSTQTATHVLECITLFDNDHSREWRSVYGPIIYTFEPSFLLKPLDIERPREAAWELGDYYTHSGGVNVVGELYWNGGYVCVALVMILIALFSYLCDTYYRQSWVWLVFQCCFTPGLLMGFGYGFAQVSRGAFNGLIAIAVLRVAAVISGKIKGSRRLSSGPSSTATLRQVKVAP